MKHNKYHHLVSVIILIVLLNISSQLNAQFKVIGYIRVKTGMTTDIKTIDFKKITHLNIAFINPDTLGNFYPLVGLDSVVELAHLNNVKVLLSCGGGSRHTYYASLLSDENRNRVVNNFIEFVVKNKLDGIDVDIEGDDIDANYENFVVALKKQLAPKKFLLTAAVSYYSRKKVSDIALAQFDFINMMAYDKTGPWNQSNPGQHSPLSYAETHLDYWSSERGIKKDKLILGVPFYGYGFGEIPTTNKAFKEMFYKDIITMFPNAENMDEVALPDDGGTIYYNGINTIKTKTELALKKAGGVMIWELTQDSNNDKSLLTTIDKAVKAKQK